MTETLVRAGLAELCLMVPFPPTDEVRGSAEARLYFTRFARLTEREPCGEHPFFAKWREIATKEQWEATRRPRPYAHRISPVS